MASDVKALIEALAEHEVRFVIIGGVALVLQGSSRTTQDFDICYAREGDNLDRLAKALEPFYPTLRGAPRDLPFRLDARTLASGLNFTLSTDAGDLDLMGEISGVGTYEEAVADAETMELHGREVSVMSLAALERAKRAAGRIKDLADLEIIESIKKLRS